MLGTLVVWVMAALAPAAPEDPAADGAPAAPVAPPAETVAAQAEPPHDGPGARRERFGFELRAGGQVPRAFPVMAVYASVGVAPNWSVGAGYDAIRAIEVTLPKSCQTVVTPVVAASARAGVWRTIPLR